MDPIALLIAGLAAGAILLIFIGLASKPPVDPVQARLNQLGNMQAKNLEELELQAPLVDRTLRPLMARMSGRLSSMASVSFTQSTEKRLALAGNPGELRVSDWMGIKTIGAVIGGVLFTLLFVLPGPVKLGPLGSFPLNLIMIPVGLYILASDGAVTMRNEVEKRIWAGTVPITSVRDFDKYEGFAPETGKRLEHEQWPATQALRLGRKVEGQVVDIKRFDGTRGTLLISAAPLRGEGGIADGAVVAVQDISELRAAQARLEEADRQKNQFLAVLSHELRNPLAPLLNAMDIMRIAGSDPTATQSAREMMARQLHQLVQLVNDLLDVSRISTGKMVLKKERAALAGIVQTALEAAAPLIELRGHRLNVDLPHEPVWLMADATRLAQVFVNLLNNAAKFTDPGGEISFRAARQDGRLIVTVTDNGLGISAGMLPVIFDMFAQADRSLERAHAGLGVGLSLARYLVDVHGGSITVNSDGAGRGSTFTVTLPTLAAEAPAAAAAQSPASAPVKHYRILLADDNVDFAASLAMLLETMDHTVLVANDGQRALEIAPDFKPDFCFLDIGLPKVHGYDLARRLRAHPVTRNAVMVAVSGWGQEEDKRRSREAGFDHHLIKPVDFSQIEAVLATFSPRSGAQTG